MITEIEVRKMYKKNREEIRAHVRKLPEDCFLEVAFYESGRVWISDPIQPYAFMTWNPGFMVQYKANPKLTFKELDSIFEERISYVELI